MLSFCPCPTSSSKLNFFSDTNISARPTMRSYHVFSSPLPPKTWSLEGCTPRYTRRTGWITPIDILVFRLFSNIFALFSFHPCAEISRGCMRWEIHAHARAVFLSSVSRFLPQIFPSIIRTHSGMLFSSNISSYEYSKSFSILASQLPSPISSFAKISLIFSSNKSAACQ